MEIRQATVSDTPEIVRLLKSSLGDTLMPKSEKYWYWKHVDNPFGQSPVLLCYEGTLLVGVRAFLQWKWVNKGQIYSAVRAVDTATHPDYQGKGIFRNLTLQLVASCKNENHQFVFNTPNSQSKPGYLKMGWIEAGKLPIYVELKRPIELIRNLFSKSVPIKPDSSSINYYLMHKKLEPLLGHHIRQATGIITKTSISYLKWRYLDVPVANYVAVGEERGEDLTELIIARVKQSRLGNELRITDVFSKEQRPSRQLIQQLRKLQKTWSIDYCTLSGTMTNNKNVLGSFGAHLPGPVVTIRSLSMTDLSSFEKYKNWSPSLGDLELF